VYYNSRLSVKSKKESCISINIYIRELDKVSSTVYIQYYKTKVWTDFGKVRVKI